MKFRIITLFPSIFDGVFDTSMMLKAKKIGELDVEIINLRDFGLGPHNQVDDTPYGGGDGMVLMVEPMKLAIEHAKSGLDNPLIIAMTPRGELWSQARAKAFSKDRRDVIILCGRYEGFDERIMEYVEELYSIGEYVLTGGEIPAMAIVDSVTRLIPGVLGGESSAAEESYTKSPNYREHPHYTRPAVFEDQEVPEVLLSGNHAEIEKWRKENSFEA